MHPGKADHQDSADGGVSEAEDFVHTGPGTLAGRYLRLFWQPVYLGASLPSGHAVPLRVLGEQFTLYRGENGVAHIVGPRCPHRRTQLSTGWIEGETIRCVYHGWRFDSSGRCVEQPAEPKPFCEKIRLEAYPTQERNGLVFGYFGPHSGDDVPPLPEWPEFADGSLRATVEVIPCNYFQHAENILDIIHLTFVHRTSSLSRSSQFDPTRLTTEETPFGLTQTLHHAGSAAKNHFLMPNSCLVRLTRTERGAPANAAPSAAVDLLFWYVPIDDTSHNHFAISVARELRPGGSKAIPNPPPRPPDAPSVREQILSILDGKQRIHDLDETHPELIRIQDGICIVGQGAIADRRKERLGTTDAGIILFRKIFRRELRALAAGEPLTPFRRPPDLGTL